MQYVLCPLKNACKIVFLLINIPSVVFLKLAGLYFGFFGYVLTGPSIKHVSAKLTALKLCSPKTKVECIAQFLVSRVFFVLKVD